jgi:NAD(P)-dependent dehydrogenase (short-subunit alcohol dehydrogenase family)
MRFSEVAHNVDSNPLHMVDFFVICEVVNVEIAASFAETMPLTWFTKSFGRRKSSSSVSPDGGNIVCVASDAGVHGGGGLIADTAYAASKAARCRW